MSAAVVEDEQAKMIPVMFNDASTPAKPKKNASPTEWASYKEECKTRKLSVRAVDCIKEMRTHMDKNRGLWVTVDGSYTNRTVLNNLPEKTILIGRIRSDAKLFYPPVIDTRKGAGRKRIYGLPAPTPEVIRTDETIAWQMIPAFVSGISHDFKVKVIKYLLWRGCGEHLLQVMVIAPLRYRLSSESPLLYRNPAYLICTDPNIPANKLLQAYLWRWDIETNFRDEKTLLGTGQAQVRNPASVEAVPQMMVASYALLVLAGIKLWGLKGMPQPYLHPKWQNPDKKYRASTNDFIKQLRSDLWADSISSMNFSHFVSTQKPTRSPLNINFPIFSAVLNVNTG
jgi:hypothetical protein